MLIAAVVVATLLHAVGHVAWWWGLTEPSAPPTAAPTNPTASTAPADRASGPSATFPPWLDSESATQTVSEPTETAAAVPTPAVPAYTNSCLRRDNPPTGATFPAGDPFGDEVEDLGEGAELTPVCRPLRHALPHRRSGGAAPV
mgnify:CR=1 FL=1